MIWMTFPLNKVAVITVSYRLKCRVHFKLLGFKKFQKKFVVHWTFQVRVIWNSDFNACSEQKNTRIPFIKALNSSKHRLLSMLLPPMFISTIQREWCPGTECENYNLSQPISWAYIFTYTYLSIASSMNSGAVLILSEQFFLFIILWRKQRG